MPPQQWNGPDKKPAAGLEWRMAVALVRWQSRVALKKEKCTQPNTARHRFWQAKASGSLLKLAMSSGNQATSSSKQMGVVVVLVV